jgi:hypothetical protein
MRGHSTAEHSEQCVCTGVAMWLLRSIYKRRGRGRPDRSYGGACKGLSLIFSPLISPLEILPQGRLVLGPLDTPLKNFQALGTPDSPPKHIFPSGKVFIQTKYCQILAQNSLRKQFCSKHKLKRVQIKNCSTFGQTVLSTGTVKLRATVASRAGRIHCGRELGGTGAGTAGVPGRYTDGHRSGKLAWWARPDLNGRPVWLPAGPRPIGDPAGWGGARAGARLPACATAPVSAGRVRSRSRTVPSVRGERVGLQCGASLSRTRALTWHKEGREDASGTGSLSSLSVFFFLRKAVHVRTHSTSRGGFFYGSV